MAGRGASGILSWALVALLALGPSVAATAGASAQGSPTPTTGATGDGVSGDVPPPTPDESGSPSPFPTVLHTPPSPVVTAPRIRASSALLLDLRSGQVLLAKNPDGQRPIASTTKIMTALVVLERARLDDPVTVSALAASQPGSGGGLEAGERLSVRELLWALLLSSANDAAVALAEHVGGTVAGFVDLMNIEADRLGLARTRYESPSGLDDRGVSTARNLATLTRYVYRHQEAANTRFLVRAAATRFHDISGEPGAPEARHLQNRNVLLWLYAGAIGVKTGETPGSGPCLIAAAERGGRRLIAVVLGGKEEVFSDAATLLDFGFDGFREATLVSEGEWIETSEVGTSTFPVLAGSGLTRLLPVGADPTSAVSRTVRNGPAYGLSTVPGTRVGSLVLRLGGAILGRVPLVLGIAERPSPSGSVGGPGGGDAGATGWWVLAGVAGVILVGALLFGLRRTARPHAAPRGGGRHRAGARTVGRGRS